MPMENRPKTLRVSKETLNITERFAWSIGVTEMLRNTKHRQNNRMAAILAGGR